MIYQAPVLPPTVWEWIISNPAWKDFPVVTLIVMVFIIAGIGARWFWSDFKREAARADKARADEAEKDRIWREKQNDKREQAVAEQNKLWREAVALRDARYEQYDRERQTTLEKIASALDNVVTKQDLQEHDSQAREIKIVVERIDREITQPRGKVPKVS
jgi:hypothetical protein